MCLHACVLDLGVGPSMCLEFPKKGGMERGSLEESGILSRIDCSPW